MKQETLILILSEAMDKSHAGGRDRGGDPRRTLNIGVPNNQSMVQRERNNPNNIGHRGSRNRGKCR